MLSPEGRLPVTVLSIVALLVGSLAGWAWSIPLWCVVLVAVWLYVSRRFAGIAQPNAVVAPVAGIVTRVDEVEDPWLERTNQRVRIRTMFPGVGPLLAPIEGKVVNYQVGDEPFDLDQRRQRWPQWAPAFATSPNCYALHVRNEDGEAFMVAASSIRPVSRARLDACPGERVSQGRRFAFAYFVDVVDVLAPTGAVPAVAKGQRVAAGDALMTGFAASEQTSVNHVATR